MASSLDSLTSSPSYQHKNQSGSTAQQPNNAAYFQINSLMFLIQCINAYDKSKDFGLTFVRFMCFKILFEMLRWLLNCNFN